MAMEENGRRSVTLQPESGVCPRAAIGKSRQENGRKATKMQWRRKSKATEKKEFLASSFNYKHSRTALFGSPVPRTGNSGLKSLLSSSCCQFQFHISETPRMVMVMVMEKEQNFSEIEIAAIRFCLKHNNTTVFVQTMEALTQNITNNGSWSLHQGFQFLLQILKVFIPTMQCSCDPQRFCLFT